MENRWLHHGYHAFHGVGPTAAPAAAVRGSLLIPLRADTFAAEEVRDVVDIVPGKGHGLGGGHPWLGVDHHQCPWPRKWRGVLVHQGLFLGGRGHVCGGKECWRHAAGPSRGGLQCLAGVPKAPYHEEIRGAVGAVWVFEGGALGGGRPSTHTQWTQVGLLLAQRAAGPLGHARTPVPGVGETCCGAGIRPWSGGPGYPAGTSCQGEDHLHGLLTCPTLAARHTLGLTGGREGGGRRTIAGLR